jgi:hypothetical protein
MSDHTLRAPSSFWSELADIAASAGAVEQRARAMLETLHHVVPYAAGWISMRDPETRRHHQVGADGDTGALGRYFSLPEADDEVEQLGLNRLRPAMRASDLPAPLPEIRAWGEYLLPAGFRDGFAMGLFAPDGRHLGFLSLLTDDPAQRTASYGRAVEELRPLFARALDRLPSLTAVARLTRDAVGGVALTRSGRAVPLPGLPWHPLLASGTAALAVAGEYLTAPGAHASFLSPSPDGAGDLVRLTVLDCREQSSDHLTGVVFVRPAGVPDGLRPADLQVLGALLHGWHEEQVAARWPHPSVAERLERMAAHLGVRSCAHLLLHAAREGVYVPPALWQGAAS